MPPGGQVYIHGGLIAEKLQDEYIMKKRRLGRIKRRDHPGEGEGVNTRASWEEKIG